MKQLIDILQKSAKLRLHENQRRLLEYLLSVASWQNGRTSPLLSDVDIQYEIGIRRDRVKFARDCLIKHGIITCKTKHGVFIYTINLPELWIADEAGADQKRGGAGDQSSCPKSASSPSASQMFLDFSEEGSEGLPQSQLQPPHTPASLPENLPDSCSREHEIGLIRHETCSDRHESGIPGKEKKEERVSPRTPLPKEEKKETTTPLSPLHFQGFFSSSSFSLTIFLSSSSCFEEFENLQEKAVRKLVETGVSKSSAWRISENPFRVFAWLKALPWLISQAETKGKPILDSSSFVYAAISEGWQIPPEFRRKTNDDLKRQEELQRLQAEEKLRLEKQKKEIDRRIIILINLQPGQLASLWDYCNKNPFCPHFIKGVPPNPLTVKSLSRHQMVYLAENLEEFLRPIRPP